MVPSDQAGVNNQPSRKNIDDHRSAAVEQHHPRRTRLNLELPLRLAVVHTRITGLCPYFRDRDFFFAVAKATTWSRLKVRHDFYGSVQAGAQYPIEMETQDDFTTRYTQAYAVF